MMSFPPQQDEIKIHNSISSLFHAPVPLFSVKFVCMHALVGMIQRALPMGHAKQSGADYNVRFFRYYFGNYRRGQWKPPFCPFMKQNGDFQEGISQPQGAATPLPIPMFSTSNESFQMRNYKRIFLKGHQNGQRTKFQTSNFT